jgi:hypothetical protein
MAMSASLHHGILCSLLERTPRDKSNGVPIRQLNGRGRRKEWVIGSSSGEGHWSTNGQKRGGGRVLAVSLGAAKGLAVVA